MTNTKDIEGITFFTNIDVLFFRRKPAELIFQTWVGLGNEREEGKIPTYKEMITYIKRRGVDSVNIVVDGNYFKALPNILTL